MNRENWITNVTGAVAPLIKREDAILALDDFCLSLDTTSMAKYSEERINATKVVASAARSYIERFGVDIAYATRGESCVTGIILCEQSIAFDGIEITHMVSNPNFPGTGKSLLEKAVNESEKSGFSGVITVTPRGTADGFYTKYGFILGDPFKLDPRTSDRWEYSAGRWRAI